MAVFRVSITFSRLKNDNLYREYGRVNKICTVSTLAVKSFQIPCLSYFDTVFPNMSLPQTKRVNKKKNYNPFSVKNVTLLANYGHRPKSFS